MIFFSNKCGQLGNRLFAFAHLIANAEANNLKIVNLSFDEYAKYFERTSRDLLCRYPACASLIRANKVRSWLFIVNKIVLKLLRKIGYQKSLIHAVVEADLPEYQFGGDKYFDLNDRSFTEKVQKPIVFLFGRFFRDYYNFEKHQAVIREFFRPLPEYESVVHEYVVRAKENADLVVGVHMRRGDYAQFANGRYFYSQLEYYAKMKELQEKLTDKKITFVLCSNEIIVEDIFRDITFIKAQGHLIVDMYLLAACDLIMGPPSTYTQWASFYGNKPLYQLRNMSIPVTMDCFEILPSEVLYNFSFN